MHCFTGITTTIKCQIDRFSRFARSRSTSSSNKPTTVQRQHIGVPRNVRKEEDPYSSLLALSRNSSDQAYLLQNKAKFSAAITHGTNDSDSNISLAPRPLRPYPPAPPKRSSSLAGTHGHRGTIAQSAAHTGAGAGAGGGGSGGRGSRDSSRTGVSGRTAVEGNEEDEGERG